MGAFSVSMQDTATALITELGEACILTKVVKGQYLPSIGKESEARTDFDTFSAPAKTMSEQFGLSGVNTNLAGFENEKVVIPYFGEEVDKTWRYNDENIVSVAKTKAQGDIIIYTLELARS